MLIPEGRVYYLSNTYAVYDYCRPIVKKINFHPPAPTRVRIYPIDIGYPNGFCLRFMTNNKMILFFVLPFLFLSVLSSSCIFHQRRFPGKANPTNTRFTNFVWFFNFPFPPHSNEQNTRLYSTRCSVKKSRQAAAHACPVYTVVAVGRKGQKKPP